jgi:hypothetical protein
MIQDDSNQHLNKMYVHWLDEIEGYRFDVTHLPGSRNSTDPLSRRGFADGNGPAPSTGDADAESQRLARDAPVPARLAAVRARWAANRQAAAATFADAVRGGTPSPPYPWGDALPSVSPRGWACSFPCPMTVPRTGKCGATAGDP